MNTESQIMSVLKKEKKKTYYKVRRLNVTIYQWLIVGSHSRERSNTNKSMNNVRKSVWPKRQKCATVLEECNWSSVITRLEKVKD